jgi:hypothetical protein
MSVRTIVEINHDYVCETEDLQRMFVAKLQNALRSGSDNDWEKLRSYGFKFVVQCHHSDDRTVIVNGSEYKVE